MNPAAFTRHHRLLGSGNNLSPLSSSLSANHSDTSDVLSTSSSPPPPSKAQQTCRFLVPLLLRLLLCSPLLSLPLLVSYRRPSTSNMFAFPSALSLLLPESYPSCSSLSKSCCFIFLKNGKRMKEETPQHPQRCPPQGGESSGGRGSRSAAGPSRCSAGWCYSLGAVKATKNRKYIYNNILSQSLPKHVPRVLKENEKNNNYSSIFPYPLLLVFLLLNLSSAPPWTDPCRISQTGQGRRWPG